MASPVAGMPTEAAVWAALAGVSDPEIPVVNIVEMGMVRGVQVTADSVTGQVTVAVQFTPTFSGCPALHVIRQDIARAVEQLGTVQVVVQTVISPPWSTGDISAPARQKLQVYGIAPPEATSSQASGGLIGLEAAPVACPRCGSVDTRVTATFGSALCKRLYVCNHCREPFEGMKTV